MRILAAAAAALPPGGVNLFSSAPPNPRINESLPPPSPLPVPARKKVPRKPPPESAAAACPPKKLDSPALRSTHTRTKYYKPVSGGVIASDGHDRAVVLGESGVSYLLPGAPFEFQFSYSEIPQVKPLAIREPAFLPFAPPTMPRPWTGKAPLKSKKEKELKKQRKVRLLDPFGGREQSVEGEGVGKVMEMARAVPHLGKYPEDGRSREEILGKPLTRAEVRALVKPRLSDNRQVNLGRDGLTHNMLESIHTHWRRQQICKVRCRGVPTVDMDNVCHHLEEKTGGKIIHRIGGVVYLFCGRNYDPHTRPRYPIMLWKPAAPVYPKLIQEAPEGLTKVEADELRKKGQNLLPICKLAKNGIYINLVRDVRDAFEGSLLVKINCQGLHASDYKKIGAKLKELVPCVLLSFDQEQILMWRGEDWKSRYQKSTPLILNNQSVDSDSSSNLNSPGRSGSVGGRPTRREISSPRMLSLWKRAIESSKALFLNETVLSPDALLEKVEEFEGKSQAAEHSYPALILSGKVGADILTSEDKVGPQMETRDNDFEYADNTDAYSDYCSDEVSDSFEESESSLPFGSLPVDSLTKRLEF